MSLTKHFFCLKAGPNPRLVLFWRGGNWKPTFSYVTNLLEVIQDPSQVSKKKGKEKLAFWVDFCTPIRPR